MSWKVYDDNQFVIQDLCRPHMSEFKQSKLNEQEKQCLVDGYCKEHNKASIPITLTLIYLVVKYIDQILKGGLTTDDPFTEKFVYVPFFILSKNGVDCDLFDVIKYSRKWSKIEIDTSPQIRDYKHNYIPYPLIIPNLYSRIYQWQFTLSPSNAWTGYRISLMCRGSTLPEYDGFGAFFEANEQLLGINNLLTGSYVFSIQFEATRILQTSELIVDKNELERFNPSIRKTITDKDIENNIIYEHTPHRIMYNIDMITLTVSTNKISAKINNYYSKKTINIEWNNTPNSRYRALIHEPMIEGKITTLQSNFVQIDQSRIGLRDLHEWPFARPRGT